jgi:Na+-translocating ferredoxin:NAD+ oxidoreductase RNF subunit RnfB
MCLELENRVATLPRPDDCGSEEHCIAACPDDAMHMRWVSTEGNEQFGFWRESGHPETETQSV